MLGDRDCELLSEWLHLLGCPMQLTPSDVQLLNKLNMRPIWRHLRNHIMPVQSIQTIRKNLLLKKLKEQDVYPGKFGNFKVESVQELSLLQNMYDLQEEIELVKGKVNTVDGMLKSTSCTLLQKTSEKYFKKQSLTEIRDKASVLNQKVICLKQEYDNLDEKKDIACLLKPCHMPYSVSELKQNISLIGQHLANQQFSSSETISDDYVNQIIHISLEYPAITIYNELLSSVGYGVQSLRDLKQSFESSLDSSKLRKKEMKHVNGVVPFSKHMVNLKTLVVQNELNIANSFEEISELTAELEKEKLVLSNTLAEHNVINSFCTQSDDSVTSEPVIEFVDLFLKNILTLKKTQKLKYLQEEVEECCFDFESLKYIMNSLKYEENTLHEKVIKKVDEINSFTTLISKIKISVTKSEILNKCNEEVSSFLENLKITEENPDSFLELENISRKEIEVFLKTPLFALSRMWEEDFHLVLNDSSVPKVTNDSLFCALLQYEPSYILKNVLEELYWLQAIEYHLKHRA